MPSTTLDYEEPVSAELAQRLKATEPLVSNQSEGKLDSKDCCIVASEANNGAVPLRGDFERMARRRYQSPEPFVSGNWWYLLFWQDEFVQGKRTRTRKRKRLAPASMGEREVKKIAAEFLRPLSQGLESIGSAARFADYVQTTYRDCPELR